MSGEIDNRSHVVMLLEDEDSGIYGPYLDVRARHSDLACLHCGSHFPLSKILPLGLAMLNVICEEFRRQHADCEEGKKVPWVIRRETT
jgi:hypothetical protein